jgi:hypothetical protein
MTQSRGESPPWGLALGALVLLAIQVGVLHGLGQPFLPADGTLKLWESEVYSPRMSQELSDWYSLSHIIHGFGFYWLLRLVLPGLPAGTRLLIAMGLEIGWEIAENTPMVIQAYRQQATAAGYNGDSIVNSLSDTAMMAAGFALAAAVKARYVIALALGFEIFTCVMIRDGLLLNIIGFVAPSKALNDWQANAPR